MNPLDAHTIYFLGIGGIGMSALARYFHLKGKVVHGYDRASSRVTEGLEALGIKVYFDLDPARITTQNCIIYTPAIKMDNPEFASAVAQGIPMLKRAEVLGLISQAYRTIAVAGTHGKTTTSTMLIHLLRSTGIDATAFLGGLSVNLGSNFVYGESDWLVVEADEYDRSFLQLHPEWAIITSLDPDHLDIYGTPESMKATYQAFAEQSKHVMLHEEVDLDLAPDPGRIQLAYGLSAERADYFAQEQRTEGLGTSFDFQLKTGEAMAGVHLPFPGAHNLNNMLGAMALTTLVHAGLPPTLSEGVSAFAGIYRRFEVHHHSERVTYIDDYAHHPSEIAAIMDTARQLFPKRQLVVVFQPHLFSRTQDFMAGFARELARADCLLLMDIYPAREKPIPGITAEALLAQMEPGNRKLTTRGDLVDNLQQQLEPASVLFTLGAGDIDKEVPKIKAWVKRFDQSPQLSH